MVVEAASGRRPQVTSNACNQVTRIRPIIGTVVTESKGVQS
jgi:hypothetical protein